jgi:mitochondrial division protein 1
MMFETRRIVAAAGEANAKVYDKTDGRHWDCGPGVAAERDEEGGGGGATPAVVEHVRIRDGYMVEGRRDGVLGVWTC